jgi:hypothetical protein
MFDTQRNVSKFFNLMFARKPLIYNRYKQITATDDSITCLRGVSSRMSKIQGMNCTAASLKYDTCDTDTTLRVSLPERPTQPPIQWVTGTLSLGVKRQEREADHSPPSSAEVKE